MEETSTSIYTAKVIDKQVISDDKDKQVVQMEFQLGRPVKRGILDVGQSIAITP